MSMAFVFPGQGSQHVGMGKDLADSHPEARDVFDEIDESLGQNLSKIMFEGSEGDLNMTENTQPALMAVSMAVIKILEKCHGIHIKDQCGFIAGHSLGEYSALTAAGAFSISDCAKLLKLRGQAMQRAVPVRVGSMAAILGLDFNDVKTITNHAAAQTSEICQTANDNSTGQVVVSGHKSAVEAAVALASEQGAKRAVMLPVSAPFHCALMQPAADEMAEALAEATINAPVVPIVSNVTATATSSPDEIRTLLVDQITGMVRWRESVLWMRDQGINQMIEIGAGKVLCGLARRIDRDIACMNASTPEEIEALAETLKR